MKFFALIFLIFGLVVKTSSQTAEVCDDECDILHPTDDIKFVETPTLQPQVFWQAQGQNLLRSKVNQRLNTNIARNVIIFIGEKIHL